jgi:hypothetical protein
MASKAPPPLIRSSKAFSVEIPEGSNSAKSRRSDIVANDDIDIHHRSSDFDAENTSASSTGQFKEDEPGARLLHVDEDPASHEASGFQEPPNDLNDRSGPGQDGQHGHDTMAGDTDKSLSARQGPVEDHSHPENLQGIAQDHLQDKLQGLAQDHLQDKLQSIPQDPLQNHLQEVSEDNAHNSAAQALPSDSLKVNLQGVAQDPLKDNVHGVGQDSLNDNVQGVGQDSLNDNVQGVGQDSLNDNVQGVAQAKLKDHLASVPSEGMEDSHAAMPDQTMADHHGTLPNEGIEDTYVALPSTHRDLKDGPAPAPSSSATSDHAAPGISQPHARHKTAGKPDGAKHHVASDADTETAHLAQLEKEKRLEEFHGRVEAIRKTVSGINHKLDELDDEPASPKSKK